MSFEFDYEIVNHDARTDVHEDECDGYGYHGYEFNECMCENITRKSTIIFKTSCGPNLTYKFETKVTFFINKLDKKNFKKFISVLKYPQKINDMIENSKQKIDQIYANSDRTDITKNRRLYYNSKDETLTLNFESSRFNNNSFVFHLNKDEIVFRSSDGQSCGHYCSCGDCEYYGRFETSLDVRIPFKTETKEKIIEAFEEVYEYLYEGEH